MLYKVEAQSRMTKFLLCCLLLVAQMTLLMAAFPALALAEVSSGEAKTKASKVLGLNRIEIHQQGFESWGTVNGEPRKCYHFVGPPKEFLSIDVDVKTGTIFNYSWTRLQSESREVVLSLDEAKKKAQEFLKAHMATDVSSNLIETKSRLLQHGAGGNVYQFAWTKRVNGIEYPFLIQVEISTQNGDVTSYLRIEYDVNPPSLPPAISAQKATELALPKIDLQPGWKVEGTQLLISTPDEGGRLLWRVRAQGFRLGEYQPFTGQMKYAAWCEVLLDAKTGAIVSAQAGSAEPRQVIQVRPPVSRPQSYTVLFFWPNWSQATPNQFLCYRWLGMEGKVSAANGAMNRGAIVRIEGKTTTKILDLEFLPFYPQFAPNGKRIVFQPWREDVVYFLDPQTGSTGRLNNPERAGRAMPAWDSSGKLLATSGTHSPSDDMGTEDEDIFVSEIKDTLSIVANKSNKCVVALPGADTLPNWSPDDKTILFVHRDAAQPAVAPEAAKDVFWIYQVSADKSYTDKDYEPPQKLAPLPAQPERLSVFPDGKRVLVSYLDNEYALKYLPQVLDIATKTLRPLKWPVLHDPDLPNGQALIPRELAVSPDGNRIAFRALRWSGDSKDSGAICIYTCNLNGGDLQRVTPPTDTAMQEFKYPQPGVTALNAWEKLQPKPNTGVLTDLKEADAEWRRLHLPDQTPPKTSTSAPDAASNADKPAAP